VFFLGYLRSELVRRKSRTILTLAGLAIGVALVVAISAVARGLDHAQKTALNPLSGIGTDLTVTRAAQTDNNGFGDQNSSSTANGATATPNTAPTGTTFGAGTTSAPIPGATMTPGAQTTTAPVPGATMAPGPGTTSAPIPGSTTTPSSAASGQSNAGTEATDSSGQSTTQETTAPATPTAEPGANSNQQQTPSSPAQEPQP